MNIKIFCFSVFFMFGASLFSRHIIGGDFSYTCLGVNLQNNTFTISCTLTVYRDCLGGGALFDNPATIGVFITDGGNNYNFVRRVDFTLRDTNMLRTLNPCVIVPDNICVEEGVYIANMTLPLSNQNYYINYQRCCRNETITNILLPGDQGASYFMEITPEGQRACNNSPKFNSFPPILICQGQPLQYDHSVIDEEGDIVIYEFCNPFTAGGKAGSPEGRPGGSALDCDGVTPDPVRCPPPFNTVQFRAPFFTRAAPMGGNPLISVNPTTGLITGVPNALGQYVVAVCIKEYRNGVLLSLTQRDFQFNVINCVNNITAYVQADSLEAQGQFVINSCGDRTVTILNRSTLASSIKTYDWEFDINGVKQTFNTKDVTLTFPSLGTYRGRMFLNKADLECNDSAEIIIKILPDIRADFSFSYDTCIAGPVKFNDLSVSDAGRITNWRWTFEPSQTSSLKDPAYVYKTPGNKPIELWVKDINGCRDSIVKNINYYPVPALLVIEPSRFAGCQPLEVFFNNLSFPIDPSYTILWEFSDGSTSNEISPTHIFNQVGVFSVKLSLISPIGCKTETNFNNWINVSRTPQAAFNYSPQRLTSQDKFIMIADKSVDADFLKYTINDHIQLFGASPNYEFQDTGLYKIEQIVSKANGCSDTAIAYIDVEPIVTYFMPNAFTPNGDGDNETFFGVGYTGYMSNFEMFIWDRWGSQIYKTENPILGWNGKFNNDGTDLPPGVYVYQIKFDKPRGEQIKLKGYVNLVR